jgi:hypothetical protein
MRPNGFQDRRKALQIGTRAPVGAPVGQFDPLPDRALIPSGLGLTGPGFCDRRAASLIIEKREVAPLRSSRVRRGPQLTVHAYSPRP